MVIYNRKLFSKCFTVGKGYEVLDVLPTGGITVKDDEGDGYYISQSDYIEYFSEVPSANAPKHIRIKYFDDAKKLEKISKGDWIDLYANKDIFIPEGERAMIPLGIALELPKGYEAHVVPRSSTFKTWGIIQTNHMGVIDNSYCGDNDQWHFPAYCLTGIHIAKVNEDGSYSQVITPSTQPFNIDYYQKGTWIHKGDKLCQFRIMECQPSIIFEEVDTLGNEDRGGFGSTGKV